VIETVKEEEIYANSDKSLILSEWFALAGQFERARKFIK